MRAEFDTRDGAARERPGFGMKAGLAASALLLTGSLIGWSASAIGAGSGSGIFPAPATSAPVAAPAAAATWSADGMTGSGAAAAEAARTMARAALIPQTNATRPVRHAGAR